MNELEHTATVAIHKVAIDYCDGLAATGKSQRDSSLEAMGLIMGEAAIIAHAMGLTSEGFQKVAKTLYEGAELLAEAQALSVDPRIVCAVADAWATEARRTEIHPTLVDALDALEFSTRALPIRKVRPR